MELVSVIVPVYNVEKYLARCIQSVCGQSYQGLEIILVDDGSKDKSGVICDEYAEEDFRIVVIHKENGGLSDARNRGIESATGEYVLFLDGDDYWDDRKALERLVTRIRSSKADVLNFSYKKYYEDTKESVPYFLGIEAMPAQCQNKKEQLDYLTAHHLYIASACNKMIRRGLLDHRLRFEQGIYSEDIEWCARLLYYAGSMDFVCENFYCYRQHGASIRHTIDDKKCTDLCNNIIRCIELSQKAKKELQRSFYSYAAYQYGTFFKVQAQASARQKTCIEKLERYKWILNYHNHNPKLQYLHIGCKILGYRNLCSLIRLLYSWKR